MILETVTSGNHSHWYGQEKSPAKMKQTNTNKKAQLSLGKMRYSLYSSCCSTDL